MKKLLNILAIVLALNFLVVAGLVGWLASEDKLNPENIQAIKEILFKAEEAAVATTQPAAPDYDKQPTLRLEDLLAKQAGRTASEQVEFIQHAFDEQRAQLDRRYRELVDLQNQVEQARARLAVDRAAYQKDTEQLAREKAAAEKLVNDKGFQDSLLLYSTLSGKQVKEIFLTLDDQTVMRYLQAMPPRTAAKIIKEFKTPAELDRVQRIMELIRKNELAKGTN